MRSYWFFTTDAADYDLRAALKDVAVGHEHEWPVKRFWDEMQPGDGVLLYQLKRRNSPVKAPQAVYAVGELVSIPYSVDQLTPAHGTGNGSCPYSVGVRYTQILEHPLENKRILGSPVLYGHKILRSRGQINYRLSPTEWEAFQEMIEEDESR